MDTILAAFLHHRKWTCFLDYGAMNMLLEQFMDIRLVSSISILVENLRILERFVNDVYKPLGPHDQYYNYNT